MSENYYCMFLNFRKPLTITLYDSTVYSRSGGGFSVGQVFLGNDSEVLGVLNGSINIEPTTLVGVS
jgi:hypothetical protein